MSAGDATRLDVRPQGRAPFAPKHRADAVFFPLLLAFLWAGLLFGFIPRVVEHFAQHKPPYLPIVHVHGAVFGGWMLLLTAQLTLVRRGDVARHRRLGQIAFGWAPAHAVVGLVTAVLIDRSRFGTPRWDPQFFSVQLADLLNFGLVTATALMLRRDGTAHKRLMLLGTIAICNAGFARWWGLALSHWVGEGYFGAELVEDYLGDFICIAAVLAYDTTTRGRPHPVFVRAAALVVGIELLAVYLYFAPGWIAFADRLLRP